MYSREHKGQCCLGALPRAVNAEGSVFSPTHPGQMASGIFRLGAQEQEDNLTWQASSRQAQGWLQGCSAQISAKLLLGAKGIPTLPLLETRLDL